MSSPGSLEARLNPRVFNHPETFVEGWYWALRSRDLKKKQVKHVELQGRKLAVYRGEDGVARTVDAHCPHMGAHLAEGMVEGKSLRCFFHNWKFGPDGACEEVPSLGRPIKACIQHWPTEEGLGMIWVWTGEEAQTPLPFPPELEDLAVDYSHGARWIKECHPNVVMINAIDAHHFNTVHSLPMDIQFRSEPWKHGAMTFANTTRGGDESWFIRLIRPFYANEVTYKLCYWFGSTGTVTVGPDWLHFYIMFTIRMLEDGKAEGQTILVTRERRGPLGWVFNRMVLFLSRLVGNYFARGDTQVFQTIDFCLRTPIAPDQAVLEFFRHIEKQPARRFGDWSRLETPVSLEAVPDPNQDEGSPESDAA